MTVKSWFFVLLFLTFINTLLATIKLKGYLSRNASINNEQNMKEFKQMVCFQMYQALIQVGIWIIASILSLYGMITNKLDIFFILIFGVACFGIAKINERSEKRAQSLTVNDEKLASQYKAVCETWLKKPFPDFN